MASDVLLEKYETEDRFREAYPNVNISKPRYRDAGQHTYLLFAASQIDLLRMLEDRAVTTAGAILAMRVMRKRSTIYFKFHCPQLVDMAMKHRETSEEDVFAAIDSALSTVVKRIAEQSKTARPLGA